MKKKGGYLMSDQSFPEKPLLPYSTIQFDSRKIKQAQFGHPQAGLKHLIWHVLTPPESHGWNCIWSQRFECLADNQTALKQAAKSRHQTGNFLSEEGDPNDGLAANTELNGLLKTYIESIQNQLVESNRLGWRVSSGKRHVQLDTNGIYSVVSVSLIDQSITLITAFLPGFGSSEAVARSKHQAENLHARDAGYSDQQHRRYPRSRRNGSKAIGTSNKRLAQRQSTIGQEDRIYYQVFRPVIQFVRSSQPGFPTPAIDRSIHERPTTEQKSPSICDLKGVLPSMNSLKLDAWKALRTQTN
jgi:hypothetical protein